MREKEASGDPDMIDLKYFLMNEVVAGVLDPSYYLRLMFRPDLLPLACERIRIIWM